MRPLTSYNYRSIARNAAVKSGWMVLGVLRGSRLVLFGLVSLVLGAVLWLCSVVDLLARKVLLPKEQQHLAEYDGDREYW